MHVTVTCRHMDTTEAIKNHVEQKAEKIKKYFIKPIECHVVLSVEKIRQQCEITLVASHFKATAIEVSENLYTSIDNAFHKIESQCRKHKEIVKDHKHNLPTHVVTSME